MQIYRKRLFHGQKKSKISPKVNKNKLIQVITQIFHLLFSFSFFSFFYCFFNGLYIYYQMDGAANTEVRHLGHRQRLPHNSLYKKINKILQAFFPPILGKNSNLSREGPIAVMVDSQDSLFFKEEIFYFLIILIINIKNKSQHRQPVCHRNRQV